MEYKAVYGNNTCIYDDPACDEIEDLKNIYQEECHTVEDFIGLAMHQMQQIGGTTTINGVGIRAVEMDQTSGAPLDLDEVVLVRLRDIMNDKS